MISSKPVPTNKRIVAVLTVHNAAGTIATILNAFIANGVDVHLIDDGSTDQTQPEAKKFFGSGLMGVSVVNTSSDRGAMDRTRRALAQEIEADYVIDADVDEFVSTSNAGTNAESAACRTLEVRAKVLAKLANEFQRAASTTSVNKAVDRTVNRMSAPSIEAPQAARQVETVTPASQTPSLAAAFLRLKASTPAIEPQPDAKPLHVQLPNTAPQAVSVRLAVPQGVALGVPQFRSAPSAEERATQFMELADQCISRGDFAGGAAALRSAIELCPAETSLQIALGSVQLHLGDLNAAQREFTKASAAPPADALARSNLVHGLLALGTCFADAGEKQAARIAFRNALRVDPSNATAKRALGC